MPFSLSNNAIEWEGVRLSDLVDVHAYLDGYRVTLGAQTLRECVTLSAAARTAADAKATLQALEAAIQHQPLRGDRNG